MSARSALAWHARNKNTPRYKYCDHAKSARKRGIPFLLTFEEWWCLWENSGRWAERGKLRGQYVMMRPGDQGAYEVGNVVIRTNAENNVEKNQHTRRLYGAANPAKSEQARKRMSEAKLGRKLMTLPDGSRKYL